jgi:dsDNA-specific endonuclease/ATPase MutS2
MNFKLGDKVLFKREKQSGVIVKVNSLYKVVVETSDGFEVNSSVNDLVKIEVGTDKATSYGQVVYHKDTANHSEKLSKQQRSNSVLKVDLHIELLTSNYHYMDNFEIVQIQLNECHNKIEKALNSNYLKLIIVHGIGTGRLKTEVHKLLRNYNLRFFLSKDAGATEVML